MIQSCRTLIGCVVLLTASQTGAQVVQLPSFHVFSVNTTVVVPDRGSVYLGRVQRGAICSSRRRIPGVGRLPGPLSRRSSDASFSSSSAQISATIIDHRKWDEAVLRERVSQPDDSEHDNKISRRAAFLTRHITLRRGATRAVD